jgi:hypothetical protein
MAQAYPLYFTLENQYKAYEEEVNKLSQEWNEEWKSACKVVISSCFRDNKHLLNGSIRLWIQWNTDALIF